MTQQLIADLEAAARGCIANAGEETARAAMFESWAKRLTSETPSTPATNWRLPVGTDEHPASDWYAYTVHDLIGRRNPQNYGHTGLDLNGDWRNPDTGEFRGNVDVGQPVWAVADGEVVDVGFSEKFRAGIVLKVDHFGQDLYVRYWHLTRPTAEMFAVGNLVGRGANLGYIDYYPLGYAHCHFDMAWQPIGVNWWFTKHPGVEWANPAWVLRQHLDSDAVDAMLVS